jgi:hypothetical protein
MWFARSIALSFADASSKRRRCLYCCTPVGPPHCGPSVHALLASEVVAAACWHLVSHVAHAARNLTCRAGHVVDKLSRWGTPRDRGGRIDARRWAARTRAAGARLTAPAAACTRQRGHLDGWPACANKNKMCGIIVLRCLCGAVCGTLKRVIILTA